MKHRIKNFVSLIIAVSMLLSLIPFYGTALDDEFAGFETLEEIPFEFELEPGDLPWEQLENAVLAASDIPACISPALAEERGHVNRLYLQEPDDYTVMFQNRDGSKTIYVFSYPVKSTGMSMNTSAAIQVNGSAISFASNNIITSRIGAAIKDYSIGYCEIQTFYGGMLTADGVNITEDARGWARGGSSANNLVYNMSGAATAEYNMNIAATANATLVPGITITPNDPTPLSSVTVMSITYSTLAGIMSFKNVSTNQYLSLTTSASPSLTTSSSINMYSRWLVQYDAEWGYILSNTSNVPNTFLGKNSGQSTLSIGSRSSLDYLFCVTIVSTENGTTIISDSSQAITSNGSLVTRSWAISSPPNDCTWQITTKTDETFVSGITLPSTTLIEQSGIGFYLNYSTVPSNATMYDISLYYADTNTEVTHDTEADENEEFVYYLNSPGVYMVYYKDSITEVKSQNFRLIVTATSSAGEPVDFASNLTYAIQPFGTDLFLTMTDADGNSATENSFSVKSLITEWDDQSQTFVFNTASGDSYSRTIFATLSTDQSGAPANYRTPSVAEYTQAYYYPNIDNINNALQYTAANGLTGKTKSNTNSTVQVYDIGGYYIISFGLSSNNKLLALKYDSNATSDEDNVIVAEYSPADTSFRWDITYVGIDTPLIKQTHSAGCGAAATLMYTYGMGLDEIDPIVNLTALQTELRTELGYTSGSYISLPNIKSYVNSITPTKQYDSHMKGAYDDTLVRTHLFNDIENGYIMIGHIDTKDLEYYEGDDFTHYINIIGKIIIDADIYYVVADCIYDEHFGIRVIDDDQLIGAINWLLAKADET